jgi:hypothetical protein
MGENRAARKWRQDLVSSGVLHAATLPGCEENCGCAGHGRKAEVLKSQKAERRES